MLLTLGIVELTSDLALTPTAHLEPQKYCDQCEHGPNNHPVHPIPETRALVSDALESQRILCSFLTQFLELFVCKNYRPCIAELRTLKSTQV